MTRSWFTLSIAVVFTGCLTWGVQEPDAQPVPKRAVPTRTAAGALGGVDVASGNHTPVPPSDDERLALSRRATAWSQLRRALIAAPEGVSSGQVERIEHLLADLRTARRGGLPVVAAREHRAYDAMLASPLAARPSVAAALRNIARQLPESPGASAPDLSQTPPAGR